MLETTTYLSILEIHIVFPKGQFTGLLGPNIYNRLKNKVHVPGPNLWKLMLGRRSITQGSWDDLTKHHLRVPAGYHHSIIKVMFKNTQKGHATNPVTFHSRMFPFSGDEFLLKSSGPRGCKLGLSFWLLTHDSKPSPSTRTPRGCLELPIHHPQTFNGCFWFPYKW